MARLRRPNPRRRPIGSGTLLGTAFPPGAIRLAHRPRPPIMGAMRFAPAIFLSAFLLFLVQSIFGKQLVPWFGGTPSTWAACMLFFQLLLLGGYLYAWALDRWCPARLRRGVHFALIGGSAALLLAWALRFGTPLLAPESWKPDGDEIPVPAILKTLALTCGLPFLALVANSPLLQRWASEGGLETRRVYRLYAVSNAGSLLGLLCFPFFLEQAMSLPEMATLWGWLFGALALAVALPCLLGRRRSAAAPEAPETQRPAAESEPEAAGAGAGRWLMWVGLSASASAMFLATTNQLTQDVALVPMLWVLPLAIYLLAFMIAFHDARWYARRWLLPAAALASLVALAFAFSGIGLPVPWQIGSHTIFLLLFCWVTLGELARLKPGAAGLTGFYLAISIGGALGGASISIGAPLLLDSPSEYYVTLLVGWALLAIVLFQDKASPLHLGDPRFFATLAFLAGATAWRTAGVLREIPPDSPPMTWRATALAGLAAAALAWVATCGIRRRAWRRAKLWPRLVVGAVILVAELFMLDQMRAYSEGLLAADRNFFGAVRVQRLSERGITYTVLTHGQINHGFQYNQPDLERQPAGYCNPNSGAGLSVLLHPRRKRGEPLRLGVAGLGVGAMAAYLREDDFMRFYEINPLVIQYAAGEGAFFSYINETPGKTEIALGDARLSLEREFRNGGSHQFDVLFLDAFSSDSVPVHLLTVEAFETYLHHLRDAESVLAINISNRFIDFRPLLNSLAKHFGLTVQVFLDPGNPPIATGNIWALMTRDPSAHPYFADAREWDDPAPDKEVLWTDSHSDLLSLLRLRFRPIKVMVLPQTEDGKISLPGPGTPVPPEK